MRLKQMRPDANKILHVIAKRRGATVRTIEDYDPNVCRFSVDATHQWKPVASEGDPFSEEIRFSDGGRKLAISANQEWLRLKIEGQLDIGVCSINKSNAVRIMEKTDVGVDLPWDVFIPAGTQASNELKTFLNSKKVQNAVQRLISTDTAPASIHIYRGAIVLYVQPCSLEDTDVKTETLLSLLGVYRPSFTGSALTSLPDQFHHLIPLVVRWSESDDLKRTAMLDDAPSNELKELVKTVIPETGKINEFLSSFGDRPWPDAVIELANLAECAIEARLRLAKISPKER